jgi:hypothetical protein
MYAVIWASRWVYCESLCFYFSGHAWLQFTIWKLKSYWNPSGISWLFIVLSFVRSLGYGLKVLKCIMCFISVLSDEIYFMNIARLQPLSDAYGLLMHTNGQWEWTLAPGISPSPRYQHAAVSIICGSSYLFMPQSCPVNMHNFLLSPYRNCWFQQCIYLFLKVSCPLSSFLFI